MKEKCFLLNFLGLILLFVLAANAEVKYLGADWDTQGDWIDKYGKNGAMIFCNKEFHNTDLPVPYEPAEKEKLFMYPMATLISYGSSFRMPSAALLVMTALPGFPDLIQGI